MTFRRVIVHGEYSGSILSCNIIYSWHKAILCQGAVIEHIGAVIEHIGAVIEHIAVTIHVLSLNI